MADHVGYQAPTCVACGHTVGEHRSSGNGWPWPPRFGVCLVDGCECREYVEPVEFEEAA